MPPTYTTGGLNLAKPDLDDLALVTVLNDDFDKIDAGTARTVNVKGAPYGATGDGTTDDRAAILAAEAALGPSGGTLVFPPGTYALASSTTLLPTTNLAFGGGATLAPAASQTLTVQGPIDAGPYRIFAGAGTVMLAFPQDVRPEWWGARGDVKTAQGGGSMTAGLTTLTAAAGPLFAPADVGKIAVVVGAGAAGATLVTTVVGYTDATHLTLAAAAGTTIAATRYALGTDDTPALNACLLAAGGACPVLVRALYGTTGVLLRTGQIVRGSSMEATGFVRLGTGGGGPTVSLAPGASGDGVRLESLAVHGSFLGAYDGVEIGTSAPVLALASGGFVRNVKVRNAGAWGLNVRCNVARLENCWAQHDQAPPAANTTAGGIRTIDSVCAATALTAEGWFPAGAFYLGAGVGSIYSGLQMELSGSYPAVDCLTIAGSQVVVKAVFATLGTQRDLIRIPTGVREVTVEMIRLSGPYTLATVLNDVDRAATIASIGTDDAHVLYVTSNETALVGAWTLLDAAPWTPFTPTWTGFSTPPTVTSRYKRIGKTVVWSVTVTANGTSNVNTLTATLPVPARAAQAQVALGMGNDNGAALTTPVRIDLSSTTVATFFASPNGNVWTPSGAKAVFFTLVYESS